MNLCKHIYTKTKDYRHNHEKIPAYNRIFEHYVVLNNSKSTE